MKTSSIKLATLVIGINHFPDTIDFKSSFLEKSKIYMDTKGALHSGTLQNALKTKLIEKKDIANLSDVESTNKNHKVTQNNFVYFQSAGASIEDIAGAAAIIKSIREKGLSKQKVN